MAFTERFEYKLEIIPPYSVIQCRRTDIIEKDGVEVARSYHRHVCSPGDDVSEECSELQAVAAALWTSEVVDAYEAEEKQTTKEVSATFIKNKKGDENGNN